MRLLPGTASIAARRTRQRSLGSLRVVGFATLFCITASALPAQNMSPELNRRRGNAPDDGSAARRGPTPQDIQARLLGTVRERLGVTDDDEWNVISDRIMKVYELRRAGAGDGAAGFRGGGSAPAAAAAAAAARGGRGTSGRTPETEALQNAVNDRMPDAEIRARMAKLRETRKANEAKLAKAQEDLRSILTIRQEATAVLLGLLP